MMKKSPEQGLFYLYKIQKMKIEDKALREKIVKYLEQFVTESRQQRLSEILENRTRHVTVVLVRPLPILTISLANVLA